jgi:predicted nucleic acid-binding protein
MPEDRKEATLLFFQETAPKHEVFISELVVGEIEATPDDAHRTRLLNSVKNLSVLPVSAEAEKLADEYLKYIKIPKADAIHIAISTVEGIDYLVTWNMEHMAKERTRRIVDNINFLCELSRLYIVTPKDFFD